MTLHRSIVCRTVAFVRTAAVLASLVPCSRVVCSAFTSTTGSTRWWHSTRTLAMPRGVKKEHLPSKICVVCDRPFNWRKKWERVWDEVTTCSKSCNRKRRERNRTSSSTSNSNTRLFCSASDAETDYDFFPSVVKNKGEDDDILRADCVEDVNHSGANEPDELNDAENLTFTFSELQKELIINDDEESSSRSSQDDDDSGDMDPVALKKAKRKAAKKAKKAERRAQRQGQGDPTAGQKECDMCSKSVDLLIRCTYDASQEWKMVCGKCWNTASGGIVDGDGAHPHYKYGGLWKNRRAQKK